MGALDDFEMISIYFDDGTGQAFDTALRDPLILQDDGHPNFIIKNNGTSQGNPAVMIKFGVDVNGEVRRAQIVVNAKLLINLGHVLESLMEVNRSKGGQG